MYISWKHMLVFLYRIVMEIVAIAIDYYLGAVIFAGIFLIQLPFIVLDLQ